MLTTTNQSIYFSNKNHVSIEDVANSLLAFKSLLEVTPDVLEKLIPGLHIKSITVDLNEIKAGSLWEDVVVKLVWGSQEKLTEDVEKLRTHLQMEELMENKKLLGAIVLCLILGGGWYLLTKSNASPEQKISIEANQNVIINIGAEITGLTSDQFKAIIDSAIARNDQVKKDAVKIVRPAKREHDASIMMNKEESTSINSSAIRAMPSMTPDIDQPETIDDFKNVEIQIRATDLDSTKKGWAAVVPSVSDGRTRMHLDPHIKVEDLIGKKVVTGDITVVFKQDSSGNKFPALIFLRSLSKTK